MSHQSFFVRLEARTGRLLPGGKEVIESSRFEFASQAGQWLDGFLSGLAELSPNALHRAEVLTSDKKHEIDFPFLR